MNVTYWNGAGVIGLAALTISVCLVAFSGAEEKPPRTAAAAENTASKTGTPAKNADGASVDPFAVPKDASAKDLLTFLSKLRRRQPASEEDAKKLLNSLEEGADLLLAAKDAEDEEVVAAVRFKFMVFNTRAEYFEDKTAVAAAKKLAQSLKDDKRDKVREIATDELLKARVAELGASSPEERQQLLAELVARLEQKGLTRDTLQLARSFGDSFEEAADGETAALAYEAFADLFSKSDDSRVASSGAKMKGIARRLRLPGNPIEIEGTTLDGKPFDWKSYRGKVVLVDYWATWCGPCIRELPNVKENYEKYHSKGFEVVGISLDDDLEAVKKFVDVREIGWVTLFSPDEATTGWDHPMAMKYGITGIPTVILVDQAGKVVSLQARGPELGALLEKLLGPADKTAPAESKPAAE